VLTPVISRPRHRRRNEKEKRLFGVGWMNLFCGLACLQFAVAVIGLLFAVISVIFRCLYCLGLYCR
jgi:hypothetical protein